MEPTASVIARLVRDVPDFPEPGVTFKDIGPLLADRTGFGEVVGALARLYRPEGIDLVAGVEARGFIVGAPVAAAMGTGFVPVRKSGKLPGPVSSRTYTLEYGSATLEVQQGVLTPGARVLLIDDVLATGGTLAAAAELLTVASADLVAVAVVLEIAGLGGRARIDAPLHALHVT